MFKIIFLVCFFHIHSIFATGMIIHQNIMLCEDDHFDSIKEATLKKRIPISTFIEKLNLESECNKPIKYVSLKLCSLNNKFLEEVYDHFLINIKNDVAIIDISYNIFDKESKDTIKSIMNFPKLEFLNVTGTLVSLKNISKIAMPLKNEGTPPSNIAKLIFMEANYISSARTRVSIYNTLAKNGYISLNWAENHLKFYKEQKKYDYEYDESTDWINEDLNRLLYSLNINQ